MFLRNFILLAAIAGTASSLGCQLNAAADPVPPTSATVPTPAALDICGLVDASEIGSLQETKITETKPSSQVAGAFIVDQCFFSAAEPNKSVVLSVYRANPADRTGQRPRKFWEERFSGDRNEEERERYEEKEEKEAPPEAVSGLGDEAFWLKNTLGGALYVLKDDSFLRISIGGIPDEDVRVARAGKVAAAALRRLTPETGPKTIDADAK